MREVERIANRFTGTTVPWGPKLTPSSGQALRKEVEKLQISLSNRVSEKASELRKAGIISDEAFLQLSQFSEDLLRE